MGKLATFVLELLRMRLGQHLTRSLIGLSLLLILLPFAVPLLK